VVVRTKHVPLLPAPTLSSGAQSPQVNEPKLLWRDQLVRSSLSQASKEHDAVSAQATRQPDPVAPPDTQPEAIRTENGEAAGYSDVGPTEPTAEEVAVAPSAAPDPVSASDRKQLAGSFSIVSRLKVLRLPRSR
jgi:hypothetical protein